MKWCRFQSGESASYGLVEDGSVAAVSGDPFGGYTPTRTVHSLESVKLLVPVVPPTFYAAGVNYREHVTEMAKLRGAEPQFPPAADVGYRANNALIAQDENVVIPKDAGELVQYEGELVAVIGRKCKHVTEADALITSSVTRQRCQRADMAERRSHVLAGQEHRHL